VIASRQAVASMTFRRGQCICMCLSPVDLDLRTGDCPELIAAGHEVTGLRARIKPRRAAGLNASVLHVIGES